MQKKLKILVSAYACSPGRGSEPGMGWNFVLGLSRHHQIHVITEEQKFKTEVNKYLDENPVLKENLTFHFIRKKRNKTLRRIWPPSYYWFYRQWQKKAWELAVLLDKHEDYDIVHQLNMVGYREPGFLWKMNKPFVWGPIGGFENSPWKFIPSLGLKGMLFYSGRNIINVLHRSMLHRPKRAANHIPSALIAATQGNMVWIKRLWNREAVLINEVGQEKATNSKPVKRDSSYAPLCIVWSGLHTPGKNLPLLLRALKRTSFPYECHILGAGEMTRKWRKISARLGVDHACVWHGWLPRGKALEIMKSGHVFCITSISDLTSTVTLEALSFGLPIVCLDHCGFSNVVTEECGIKIPVTSPLKAAADFALALGKLYSDEEYRQRLSTGAIKRSADYNWDKKTENLNSVYISLLEK